jgi:hypothetical protein
MVICNTVDVINSVNSQSLYPQLLLAGGWDGCLYAINPLQSQDASPPVKVDERAGRILSLAGEGGKIAVGSNDGTIAIFS